MSSNGTVPRPCPTLVGWQIVPPSRVKVFFTDRRVGLFWPSPFSEKFYTPLLIQSFHFSNPIVNSDLRRG
ncbi:hypothetical protein T06_7482 [Trichinella sp. T6]|nr:hypothetical protein T06_7482 [Trichinella sp. T6]